MAPINNNKNPNIPKKQTGTVPKFASMMMQNNNSNGLARDLGIFSQPSILLSPTSQQPMLQQQQQQQKSLLPTKSTSSSNKSKSSTSYRSGASRKNTEVVAPTRRELNDLNDYLLISSTNSDQDTKQNNSHNSCYNQIAGNGDSIDASTQQLQHQQGPQSQQSQQHLDSSCYDIENINFQENQRFCYPVRPIPRRSVNKKHSQQQHNIYGEQNLNISNTSSTSSSAAVGVVIPTTPGNPSGTPVLTASSTLLTEENYNLSGINNSSRVSSSTTYQNILCDSQQVTNANGNSNLINNLPIDINGDLSWEERLNFIQYFLSVTSKLSNQKGSINQYNMVNETGESKSDEIFVNSTSLEDVAQSESSDRAHSVSSIHTLSGAEPSTPNYEELQQRLESSNRNIQNIKDQQQQLLRLQQAAKQHLSDMEELRNQTPIRFNGEPNGNGAPPDYESVEQVHNDMAALVNRMKNLQTFIQNQNELSASLGEDSPDLLAEQELLQRKLNELKSHRTEMRNLVDELQNINTSAEKTITQQQQATENYQSENHNSICNNHGETGAIPPPVPNRVVPIEYQRVVPIELVGSSKKESSARINASQHNGHTDTEDDNDVDNDEMDAETANMIKQKVADINTMKKQLQRLKEMMETVKLIEEKNEGPTPKEIGREDIRSNTSRNSSKTPIEVPTSMQRDFTNSVKKAYDSHNDEQSAEEAAMSERVRLLHEMTDDLRNQAMSLTSERDRLKALREELKRRRDFEINEKKSFNNKESENLTTLNNTLQHKGNNSRSEQSALEIEYEEKKKEFRRLCERLQSEEDLNDDAATVTGNEDNEDLDDEPNGQTIKQERSSYASNWQRNATSTSCNSLVNQEKNSTNLVGTCTAPSAVSNGNAPNSLSRGKDSADSGAADVHANAVAASIEAGSMQSGSSRSYSMPPPMRSINNPAWRKNSHDHGHLHGPQPIGCEHFITGAWNSYPLYQNPYGHIQLNCGQSGNNAEYACSNHTWNNLGINTASSTNTNALPNSNDPVLLQQFIQTQQMLVNSICQCNQMLWHQQREINNLNNTVVMLQERILNSTADLQSLQGNNRSESVPPLPQNSNLFNMGMNRAQSDQPLHASATIPGPLYSTLQQQQQSLSTPISPNRHCHAFNYNANNNFLQQQHHQRRHHIQNQNGASTQQSMTSATTNLTSSYNYSQEQTASNIYGSQPQQVQQSTSGSNGHMAFNNGQPMHFLNNDPSHQNNHPAGPIFMHHHNNNIGGMGQHQHAGNINNSNSNLLHQNAANSPTSTTAALNNQVPPGTRANNYWDNFRSYSRQNLLSSNSCKSNEELNHQMQQQHQQHLQQQQVHQQQQQQTFSFSHVNNSSAPYNLSPISSTNNINIQNECRPLSSVSAGGGLTSTTNLTLNVPNSSNTNLAQINSNNLNPLNYENKYLHTFRNEFNSNNQPQTGTSTVSPGPVQPLNLTSTSGSMTNTTINPHSSLNVESTSNLGTQTESIVSSVPFNNNINSIQHLEVNQGGSASSNLSVAQSDNVNENIFDFNSGVNSNYNNNNININSNSNNINNNSNNAANVASIFGSPDFRNMNFNFGLHEPKKVPMKTACTTSSKRLRHMPTASNNTINSNDIGSYGENNIGNNYSNQSNHNILNHHNNDHHRYEEMNEGAVGFDETSEEIKRNLLVNALKSDKFTSKFFESLKEDVYRQAYAIIQEKKSDPQFLIQLFEEIKGAPAYDPLRNMLTQSFHNLNVSTPNQRNFQHRTNNDTESNDGDNEMENEESSPAATAEAAVAAAVASATNTDILNYYKVEAISSPPHSINSQSHLKYTQQPNMSTESLYQRNSAPNLSNSENIDLKSLFLSAKDYKFPHDNSLLLSNNGIQQKNKSNDLRNERAANQQYLMRNYNESRYPNDIPKKRPESHIINYTIFKIRKEIQKQQIDDATLLKIVKITIQTLEDAIANLQQPSPVLAASLRSLLYRIKLSTKEIFTKMKNYQNQEKDNFLANYQNYLNKLLIEDSNNVNLAKPTRHFGEASDLGSWQTVTDNNQIQNKASIIFNNHIQWNEAHSLPKQSVNYKSNISAVVGNEAKVMNNSDNQNTVNEIFLNLNQQNVHTSHRHLQNQNQQHQHDIASPGTSSNNIMNEDLAEADQICSSSNPTSIGNVEKVIENNNDRQLNNHGSNSDVDDSCVGAVGYSNVQNSNDESELISNDKDITTNEHLNNVGLEDGRHYNGEDIDEDSENNIIDCDNDKVEDDQDFKASSSSVILINDPQNVSKSKDAKIFKTGNPLQVRPKPFKSNRKSDMTLEDNENFNEFNELALNNPEGISTDSYASNSKSINVMNSGSNSINNLTLVGAGNNFIVTSSGNATNNACAYIFPMSIESDSMINNNLDSGYQSFPQPDSSSSLSNSHTESVESNGSSVELATGNTNSCKRNSVP